MKKLIFILGLIGTHIFVYAQLPSYKWAYGIGDVSEENLDALVTDSENNVIIGGQMYSSTDMDPTEFSHVLNQIGLQDAFIEKFDESGFVQWAHNFGGPGYDGVYKLAVDNADNIYAIGYFAGTADFDPDMVDEAKITSKGGYDMFMVKFDKNGEFIWVNGFGALEDDWINNITIDKDGNIYISGQFKGIVDFDGSAAGVLEINSTLDLYDGFVAKYNTDGEVSWAFRMGGFYDDIATELVVDQAGNIIVTGTFQGTADFDGQFLDAVDGTMPGWPKEGDVYIAKYSADADLIWAKSIKGDPGFNGGYSNMSYAMALDGDDNIYITGLIYGKGDFNMDEVGESILTTYADYDSYFAKYTSDGNFVWAHATAPKVLGYNLDMVIDDHNDIYLTGDFGYSAGIPYEADFDFDPDSIFMLQSLGEKDIYIAKYDSSAAIKWAYNLGGSGYDYATAIALDKNYSICVGGWFYNSDDFDANPDSNFIWLPYTIPSYGDNIWMGKYTQDGLSSLPSIQSDVKNSFTIYPNPATDILHVSNIPVDMQHEMITIENMEGRCIISTQNVQDINISELPAGIYFIRIGNSAQKFIRQ